MGKTKAVLIFGGSGFLGTHLALKLRDGYKVFATYHAHPMRIPGVTFLPSLVDNRNWVKRMVYTIQPEIVIFAAGRSDPEWAEANDRATEYVHTAAAAAISSVTEIFQPKFVYLSSCYTFDGQRGNYHENDIALPGNILGKAKIGGENFIRGKCLNYVIIRSSPVLGRGNGYNLSFVDRLRMSLDRGQRIEVPAHELHSFTVTEALTGLVAAVINHPIRNKILHFGGLTKVSHFELAQTFARRFKYDPGLIVPKGEAPVGMPADFSLNSSQAVETLKIKPLVMEQCLDLIEKQLIPRS